jgi:hypothetical protein
MGYLAVAKGPHDFYGDPLSRAKPEDKKGLRGIFAKYDPKKSSSPKYGREGDKTVDKGSALGQSGGNKAATKATFKGHSGKAAGTKGGHMSDSFERNLESIMERVFFSPTKFHKIGNVPGGRTWPQYESGGNGGKKGKSGSKVVWETPDNPGTKQEDVGSNMSPIGTRRSPGETEGGQPPAKFVQGGEGRRRSHESLEKDLDELLFEDDARPLNTRPKEIKPLLGDPKTPREAVGQVLDIIDELLGGIDFHINKDLDDVDLNDMPFDDPEKSYRDLSTIFGFGVDGDSRIVDIADKLLQSESDI